MAAAVAGQIYLMTFAGRMNGQRILNTFHYRLREVAASVTTQQITSGLNNNLAIADGSGNRFDQKFKNLLPPQYEWEETWIQCIDPVRQVKDVYMGAGPGTHLLDGHWPNSAAVLTRRAEQAGRQYVGSLHVIIPSELDAVAGSVPAAYKADMVLLGIQMLYVQALPGLSANLDPILYHKGKTPNHSTIKSVIAQETVRVMRRRTVGLGI